MIYANRKLYRAARGKIANRAKKETHDQSLGSERVEAAKNHSVKEKPTSKKSSKKPLIAIVGPTGSGKTDLAIYLAKKLGGELISADSRQIYRGLDIGTGKDSSFPHHLVNVVDVSKQFSVNDFIEASLPEIQQIHKIGKIPIVVGGTGYYVDALLFENRIAHIPPNPRLSGRLGKHSTEQLYTMLSQKDAVSANRIGPTNRRRLIRALEIILQTGKPVEPRRQPIPLYNHLILAIDLNQKALNQKIDRRIDRMIHHGLIQESQWLASQAGVNRDLIKTIGYQETIEYLQGKFGIEEMAARIKSHTHQLAKKQINWWRRYQDVHWVKSKQQALSLCKKFLNNANRVFKPDR